jgi:uridine phosphorylase
LLTPGNDVVVAGDPARNKKIKELMKNSLKEYKNGKVAQSIRF